MEPVIRVLSKYVRGVNGIRQFIGDPGAKEDFYASTLLAKACSNFREDDNEEIYVENARSCYNCRYRRWARQGFTCHKNFAIEDH